MKAWILSGRNIAYGAAVMLCVCLVGCSGAEYRAENLPSRAELQKEIDTVTNSTKIPPGAKPMILKGLRNKLERAKN